MSADRDIYFDHQLSLAQRTVSVEDAIAVIADNYIKSNPPGSLSYRAFSADGIQRATDYRYDADFNLLFPDAKNEECVCAWARMWSSEAGEVIFDINCYSPLRLYLNGDEAWRSNIFTERHPEEDSRITLVLKQGWNDFVIQSKKTCGGFGWKFGSWIGKHPYVFMMPSPEREGQEGWLFTHPLPLAEIILPPAGQSEEETGLLWNPSREWPVHLQALGVFTRIFGQEAGKTAIAWTQIINPENHPIPVSMKGTHAGGVRVFCDGVECMANNKSGDFSGEVTLSPGPHDLMVCSTGNTDGWDFELVLEKPGGVLEASCPCDLQGSTAAWLFSGPFDPEALPDLVQMTDFLKIHDTLQGPGYWRIDAPNTYLRLYNDNPLFGHWNYPLGVTLYGLLHTAIILESDEIRDYVCAHVQFCCSTYPYSVWERDAFGGATHIHHLLSSIDSLDDCGSFGSCMLETASQCEIKGFEPIAKLIGEHISRKQDRFKDGAFMRREMMHAFHNRTMWADDLYMSVPFLCRYYQYSGKHRYIDDAANQFFGFKKRLYIPEHRLMSHVYDMDREKATGIPWGRGNGWTVFSLSELLQVLPKDHQHRDELIHFFRELCAGILALQDPEGMWHQVLTHPESYPETSCTSMFICAFSRGVRHGWLEEPDRYSEAAVRAWDALTRISIDREGNVHGVCRGSEFSFTPDYYINELLWKFNDTHGMGIVPLAGVEVIRLMHHHEKQSQSQPFVEVQ